MSKFLRSLTSSSVRYSRSLDAAAVSTSSTMSKRRAYGRLGPDGQYETAGSSFTFRIPRKLRILKLGSRKTGSRGFQRAEAGEIVDVPSKTFFGRFRGAYERVMLRAASKGGEMRVIPVAKAERAPPALSSVVSTWMVRSAPNSRVGIKVNELDPGFKMTAVERKYLEYLKRTASSGRI